MFTICIFCLFMSSQLLISSFSSNFAVKTDNKLYSFSISTIAVKHSSYCIIYLFNQIVISIVLAIFQIPGSAAYAQAFMVTLTALVFSSKN